VTRQSIAVMASGRGTNLAAILEAANNGKCPVDVRVVISNKVDAPALKIARDAGVDTVLFIDPKKYSDRSSYDQACIEVIQEQACHWVVLAGYMRILSSLFVAHFKHRLINIHPSLLPSFTGANGVADALTYGVKFSGCTVHLVSEQVDEGAILAQAVVPVMNDDTVESLHQRIHQKEYQLYPDTLRCLVEKGFRLDGRRVIWNS